MRDAYVSRTNAKRAFRVWYLEAKKSGRKMDSFGVHWRDFWQAIPKVKYAAGVCLEKLYGKAIGRGLARLESFVRVLDQYHGGGDFALSSHAVAKVFGTYQPKVSLWIRTLVSSGVLEVTKEHSWGGCAAREYRLVRSNPFCFEDRFSHAKETGDQLIAERSDGELTNAEKPQKAVLEGEKVDRFAWLRELSERRRIQMGIKPNLTKEES